MRTGSYGTYSELYGALKSISAPANQTELYPTGSKQIFVRTFGVQHIVRIQQLLETLPKQEDITIAYTHTCHLDHYKVHDLILKRCQTLIENNFTVFVNFQERFYVCIFSKININKVVSIHFKIHPLSPVADRNPLWAFKQKLKLKKL